MNKVYVITGATSGIGRAAAEMFAKGDNIVFAGYRSEEKGKELLNIYPKKIYPFYVDYDKPETIKQAADYIKSKCSKVDTLINAAGCVVAGPIEKINIDEIRHQFNVNVFGHIEMTQNLSDYLEGGRIINISSMASFGVFPFIAPYCASKKALDMFFNSFLLENKKNIKVISIKPGVITTPLWEKSISANSKYLENCVGYEKEMDFMIRNARRNETHGSSVEEVVKTILKADSAKNPKLSYLVGHDAVCASILTKIPQAFANKLIRLGLKLRMK